MNRTLPYPCIGSPKHLIERRSKKAPDATSRGINHMEAAMKFERTAGAEEGVAVNREARALS
jgi:hypothetical protein